MDPKPTDTADTGQDGAQTEQSDDKQTFTRAEAETLANERADAARAGEAKKQAAEREALLAEARTEIQTELDETQRQADLTEAQKANERAEAAEAVAKMAGEQLVAEKAGRQHADWIANNATDVPAAYRRMIDGDTDEDRQASYEAAKTTWESDRQGFGAGTGTRTSIGSGTKATNPSASTDQSGLTPYQEIMAARDGG